MNDKTLLPCPFCGGDAHIGKVTYSKPLEDACWADDGAPITEAFFGHCARCAATHGGSVSGGYRTEEQAIERWNTRTSTALQSRIEALEAALRLTPIIGSTEDVAAFRKREDEWYRKYYLPALESQP